MRMGAMALTAALLTWMSGCKATDATRNTETATSTAVATPRSSPSWPSGETSVGAGARDGRPILVCFGDSLTAGYGVDAEESYPSRLQADLDNAGYNYRVVNMGISGETTKDGLARVDRVIAMHPALAVVEFGGNDGLRGIPIGT